MSKGKQMPLYQDVDGFRIAGAFSADVFRSGLKYKPQKGDFFISTFPKCGTTWVQQIISLIYARGQSTTSYVDLSRRTPFLEMVGQEGCDKMLRPGTIKIHLPYHLTPMSDEAKYLYVVRNPKDVVVSFYHHTRSTMYDYQEGEFNDFFELFMNGETDFGDYFDSVLSWYEHRNDANVMFLTYEELKRENVASIKKIAKFMGDEYFEVLENEPEVLKNVLKYSSIEHMRGFVNDSLEAMPNMLKASGADLSQIPLGLQCVMRHLEKFTRKADDKKFALVRKGIVGDWRNNFSEDQARRMDAKIEAKLKGTDLYNYWKSINCI